ncbi:MAG: hypothetical protein M3285_11440 [Actinomycetota bacterium]|nr:hypothetical protein [Actinomycetota bacterium]
MRKLMMTLLSSAFALTALATPSVATEHGTTCGLTGSATFKPGLTVTPTATKYKFKGALADCQSTGDVTSGKVKASGSGNVACEGGTTTGKAKILWDTGKSTLVAYDTTDVGALVVLKGTVTKSSEPAFIKGDTILGAIVFEADAAQCASGLKAADFFGQVGGGSPT